MANRIDILNQVWCDENAEVLATGRNIPMLAEDDKEPKKFIYIKSRDGRTNIDIMPLTTSSEQIDKSLRFWNKRDHSDFPKFRCVPMCPTCDLLEAEEWERSQEK